MSGFVLYISLAVATLAVSWAAIIIRLADADPITTAFYRMLFAAILMFPAAMPGIKKALIELRRRDLVWLAASGFALGLHFAFWISSLKYTSISNSVVLVATQPFFIAAIEWLIWKDKVTKRAFWGMTLALVGMVIISWADLNLGYEFLLGDILALAGAVCAGIYLLFGRRIRQRLNNRHYVFPVHLVAAVTLLAMVPIFGSPLWGMPGKTWLCFFLLALIPTIMGHTVYNYLLKFIKAHLVAVTILGEPIGATVFAAIIFAEYPHRATYVGGGLILLGIIIALLRAKSDPGLAETA